MMSSGADSGRGSFKYKSKNPTRERWVFFLNYRLPCVGRDLAQRSYVLCLNTIFRSPIQRDSCIRRKDGVFKERRSARGETRNKDIKYDKMKLWITLLETIVLFLFEERKQIIRWYIRWLTL